VLEGFEHELLGEVVQRQQVAVDAALGGTIRRCRNLIVVHPGQGIGLTEVDGQLARIELQSAGEGVLQSGQFARDRGHLRSFVLAEAGARTHELIDGQFLLTLVLGVEVGDRDLFDAVEEVDVEQELGLGGRQEFPGLGDGVGEFGTQMIRFDGCGDGGDAGHRHGRGFEPHGGGEERGLGVIGDDRSHLGAGEIGGCVNRGQQRLRGDRREVGQRIVGLWVEERFPDIDAVRICAHSRRFTFLAVEGSLRS
jgi:hypothetical protein